MLVNADGELGGPVAKNLSDGEIAGLAAHVKESLGECDLLRRRRARTLTRTARGGAPGDRQALRTDR